MDRAGSGTYPASVSSSLHSPRPAVRLRALVATAALLVSGVVATGPSSSAASAAGELGRTSVSDFRIATFNILGSQHTRGPGGYRSGRDRARTTARIFEQKMLDLIGMQEVQEDQLRVLSQELERFRIWPGKALGNGGVRLQIAWRTSKFKLLNTGRISTRFNQQTRPIPWVLLRDRTSGRKMYVIDVHNSPRHLEGERDSATRAEIRLIRKLRATGRAVFVVGDMNEKDEWFCKLVGGTDLRAANGGHAGPGGCHPPKGYLPIDWIMGGRRVGFSGYRYDDGRRVRSASDHRLIRAVVTMRPRR